MPRQPNPQNRLACDRCHGQKLRCPRQEGQGACQRCLRANATCVFSPRQKRTSPSTNKEKQPSKPQPQATSQAQAQAQSLSADQRNEVSLDLLDPDILFMSEQSGVASGPGLPDEFMDTCAADSTINTTDWTNFLGLATPSVSPWDYPTQPSMPNPLQSPSSPFKITTPIVDLTYEEQNTTDSSSGAADTPSGSSTTDSLDGGEKPARPNTSNSVSLHSHIRRLADLAVKLYDQFNMLPPVCDEVTQKVVKGNMRDPGMTSQLIAIDEVFKMTQALIDIMIDFYPPDGKPSRVIPDQGAVLLLLSCTDRVLDIFELLFAHMRACLANKFIPMLPNGKPWALPELRIGSYTPPAPTAITMHMLTIILMASHLFDQLQEVLGVGRHGAGASQDATVVLASHDPLEVDLAVGIRSKFPDFTEEAKLAVTRRARSVASDIISARGLLLSLPGMGGSGSFGTFAGTAVGKES